MEWAISCSVVSVCLLIHAVVCYFLLTQRKEQLIRFHGAGLLCLTAFGCCVAAVFLILYDGVSDIQDICTFGSAIVIVIVVTTHLPFGMRVYRIYRIFYIPAGVESRDKNVSASKYSVYESTVILLVVIFTIVLISVEELLYHVTSLSMDSCSLACVISGKTSFSTFLIIWMAISFSLVFLSIIAIVKLRMISEQFNMNFELKLYLIINALTGIFYVVMFIVSNNKKTFSWRLCILAELFRTSCIFCLSILRPLYLTFFSPPPIHIWPNSDSLLTLDSLLHDMLCVQYFRRYLMSEWAVENLLAWVEFELYHDIRDADAQLCECRRLYEKYIKPESELEISVSNQSRIMVEHLLSRNVVSTDIMLEIQDSLFKRMNSEYYPKFLASDFCRELLSELEREESIQATLIESGMLL